MRDRVVGHFRRQATQDGVAEVSLVEPVGVVDLPTQLVRAAAGDLAVEPFHVVATVDEAVRQVAEQRLVAGGIGEVQVVRRFNDADVEV